MRKRARAGHPGARRHRAVRVARTAREHGARDHRHQRQDHRHRARRPPAAQRRHGLRGGGQHRARRCFEALRERRRERRRAAWVLELSSYQLETTWSLAPRAAAMLNLTEDHLDRYAEPRRLRRGQGAHLPGAGVQVLNRDDPRVAGDGAAGHEGRHLRARRAARRATSASRGGKLVRGGAATIAGACDELPIRGSHNVANALAALRAGCQRWACRCEALRAGLQELQGPAAPAGAGRRRAAASSGTTIPRAPTSARPSPRCAASARQRC